MIDRVTEPDNVLRRVTANGDVVMVSFVPGFTGNAFSDCHDAGSDTLSKYFAQHNGDRDVTTPLMDALELAHPAPPVTVADVADHVEQVRDGAGIDHVGIGSDFDGIDFTGMGLEDGSKFPNLLEELVSRGWSNADLRKLTGENFLHVLDAGDAVRSDRALAHSSVHS